MIVSPVVLLSMMLASGFYVNTDNIPVFMVWLKYLSYQYWGYSGMMVNEYAGRHFDCSNRDADTKACPIDGDSFLRENGLEDASISLSYAVLGAMAVLFRLAAYALLRWRT